MAHQVIDIKCPGCGAPTSTGETTCKYCHRPVIISTFNSVYSMPLPEVNKYAGAYRKALSENPDSMELNNSVAMCYLKLKLYRQVERAYDLIQASPVKSAASVHSIESQVINEIDNLGLAVRNGDAVAISGIADKIARLANERNRLLRLVN